MRQRPRQGTRNRLKKATSRFSLSGAEFTTRLRWRLFVGVDLLGGSVLSLNRIQEDVTVATVSPAQTAVVLPVRGHDDLLDGCLKALRGQDVPPGEVILVDDSTSGDLIAPPGMTVLRSGGLGPYGARNLGWRASEAEIILFVDARSRPRPQWLTSTITAFENDEVALVGSDTRVIQGGSTLAERASVLQQFFALENYTTNAFFWPYFPTCNLAVRRAALEEVNGFPSVRSGGDAEFCWKVLQSRVGRFEGIEETLMDWIPRRNVGEFLEQNYRYGRSHVDLCGRWPQAAMAQPMSRRRIARRVISSSLKMALARSHDDRAAALRSLGHVAFNVGERIQMRKDPRPRHTAHEDDRSSGRSDRTS